MTQDYITTKVIEMLPMCTYEEVKPVINFILSEVEREVKEYVKGLDSLPWDEQVDEDVSKVIGDLMVK